MKRSPLMQKPVSRQLLGRGLLLFGLLVIILVEAWSIVLTEHAIRETAAEYAHTLQAQREAQTQWSRLVLEYGHLKTPLTLEQIAKSRLKMTYKPPEQIITINEP